MLFSHVYVNDRAVRAHKTTVTRASMFVHLSGSVLPGGHGSLFVCLNVSSMLCVTGLPNQWRTVYQFEQQMLKAESWSSILCAVCCSSKINEKR